MYLDPMHERILTELEACGKKSKRELFDKFKRKKPYKTSFGEVVEEWCRELVKAGYVERRWPGYHLTQSGADLFKMRQSTPALCPRKTAKHPGAESKGPIAKTHSRGGEDFDVLEDF